MIDADGSQANAPRRDERTADTVTADTVEADPPPTYWALPVDEVLRRAGTTESGLGAEEAARRLDAVGPNRLAPTHRGSWLRALAKQFTEPIILILIAASVVSMVLHDVTDAAIILAIVGLSGLLSFWQEHRASVEVQRLLDMVQVHADLRRDGTPVEVSLEEVVPGDVVVLNAGDVVPGDCRVIEADALQVDQAALTGETFPAYKHPEPTGEDAELGERHSALFLGSHVVSGRGLAVVVATGSHTELGGLSRRVAQEAPVTGFQQGIRQFGMMLARVTGILAVAIMALNLVLDRPFTESLLFSLSLAVGLTPQMLPAIVAVSLSRGAHRMAREQVIVRRLDAIQDFGAMDVLCTDKTGTLTEGAVHLHAALDTTGTPSALVQELAAANAGLQDGFANPIDTAILASHPLDPAYRAVAELPYDFSRKRLSVLVDAPDGRQLVCKGAYDSVVDACRVTDRVTDRAALDAHFAQLSQEGYRVLGIARRRLPDVDAVTLADEQDLEFMGFLAFADPAKAGTREALGELRAAGVSVRMITGDNRLAAAHIAAEVGMDVGTVLTGRDVDELDHEQLVRRAQEVEVFAEMDPLRKERVISSLRDSGATVGYLGDGINDAAALHLADVGISVDTAVDVAKNAAAIVLLDKDLAVLGHGVRLGRQTFANTLKYVFTTVSANFGNVASMVVASAFLPFLPLLPRQLLLLNFLSDIPSTTIAVDNVDSEQLERPQHWDLRFVRDFMVVFGLLSTLFDLLTFAVLLHVFDADSTLFRSAWFVGSTLTELAVLMVLRTRRPAIRSRPGSGLVLTSVAAAAVTLALPFVPGLSGLLGLDALPARVVVALLLITLGYVLAAEALKRRFYRSSQQTPRPGVRRPGRERLLHVIREHGGVRRTRPTGVPPGAGV
ncbi:magnesium-translocating P-type ATPase [Nocardioides jishulii]|uniref:Magnesium-transporting ATPase, P-type 1 n=1 Tax=Nocardioides jishulii TaxID=2575440 RepID=A0A4V5TR47_9ACTN|nr:magnesium-translocating P-type ATPase [Nocardioides jishulii]QCX28986.1 magnesium-translocating P-type ATPase [Nocardioides jishulii]TKI64113.1 magnesium-translocating P-type ATPase [Nocardioides jishulii]